MCFVRFLKSKLQIPALLKGWIERDRLTSEFVKSDRVRLIALQAPAGFGKTTLIRQFLEHQEIGRTAWLHLENLDSDPRRFTGYVVEALGNIYPSLKQCQLSQTVDNGNKTLTDLHDDLLFLLEELDDSTGWLVLDNWEDVDGSEQVRELIQRILSLDNTDLRLVIASRKPLALKTAKLRAGHRAVLLGEKELAFNLYECESMIHNHTGKAVDSEVLERLWKATAGWCVSVNLYLPKLETENGIRSFRPLTNESENTLDSYIDEEIVGTLDLGLSDFVVRCSVLDSISLESASVVCKAECDIKSLMQALSSSSLPQTSLNAGLEIRLHPLFRQAANKILHRKYAHEDVVDIYSRASEYFIGQDRIVEAIESHTRVGDWKAILALIDTHWYELVAANALSRIADWLDSASPSIKTTPPYIDMRSRVLIQVGENQKAIAYLSDNLDPERFRYETARLISLKTRYHWARINTEPDPAYEETLRELTLLVDSDCDIGISILAGVEVVLCAAAYMELKLDAGIDHAKRALELIGDSLPEYRFNVQDNLAILEHTRGNSREAINLFNGGIDYCQASGSVGGVPLRAYNKAWIYANTGDYKTAIDLIESGRETSRRHNVDDVYSQMYADRYEGVIRYYLGEHQKGFKLMSRAMGLAKEHNPKEHLEIAIAFDYCQLMSGKARSEVDESAVPAQGERRETRLCYLAMRAYESALAADAESIDECANEMHDIASSCGMVPWQIHACFLQAMVCDLKGDTKQCQDRIDDGLAKMASIKWISYPMTNELLSAFVFVKAVRHDLRPSIATNLVESVFRVDIRSALVRELQSNLTVAEITRLLQAVTALKIRGLSVVMKELADSDNAEIGRLASDYLLAMDSDNPHPLGISTLGSFEVVQGGRPVQFGRKTSLRLFQWLLTVHPRQLHRDVIIDYFWPNVSFDKGSSSLRTTLKDCRKALDPLNDFPPSAYLNVEDNHYSLSLPDKSHVDSVAFLGSIGQAESLAGKANRQDDQLYEDYLRKALALHEGEYLPKQLYEEFAVEQRESILSKYLRASNLLSQFLMKHDRTPEAITVLRAALRFDTLWGDGIYLLIKALSDTGLTVEAMRTYRNYERKLDAELQVKPDTHMVDLFRRLSS